MSRNIFKEKQMATFPPRSRTRTVLYLSLLMLFSLYATSAVSQENIRGRVTGSNGEPLAGVTVSVEGIPNIATKTDTDGRYAIYVPADAVERAVLVFSYMGHATERATAGRRQTIDVTLTAEDAKLDEVVVVGYGTQKKTSITNAIGTVGGEQLVKRPVSNAQQAVQGILPGVAVRDLGGKPGQSAAAIRIRGVTTFNTNSSSTSGYNLDKNNALVIVDGIEQPWASLNPNDIESISFLKDASSTAIYGSRATNGVILVTTKSAREGKAQVEYNSYLAVQKSINRPRQMALEPYMRLQQEAYRNAGLAVPARFTDESIAEYVAATDRQKFPLPNTWFETLLRTAHQQDHALALSGGGENLRSRLSLRYNGQDGIIDNYGNDLAEIRLNNDLKATDWLNFSGNVNFRHNAAHEPSRDPINGFFHGTLWAYPKYPDGSYGLSTQGNNPLMFVEQSGLRRAKNDFFSGVAKADVKLLEQLTLTSQFGARAELDGTKTFLNAFSNTDPNTGIKREYTINSLTEIRDVRKEYTWNNLLAYEQTFDRHRVSLLGGYSQIHNYRSYLSASRERFYNNAVTSIGQGADDATKDNGGYDADYGLRSFFGRANYDWDGRYLLEVNGRYDGSSRFAGGRQYGFFPSASVGWTLSREAFWQAIAPALDDFKLRGSLGKTGNQSVDLYSYHAALVASGYVFGGQSVRGFRQNAYANRDLGWESTTQWNIGLDASLLSRRLSLTIDHYNKTTDDILLNLDIPAVLGLDPSPQNAGSVLNRGWEFALSYRNKPVSASGLSYTLSGNFSINHNEVTDLRGTGPYIAGSDINPRYIIAEGLPINTLWGYRTEGLFQSEQEITDYGATYAPNTKPGDVKYLDLNGDGIINADDMTAIGQSFPKYAFGLSGHFGWKNFDLDLLFQGTAKSHARLAGALAEMGNQEGFTHEIFTDGYWTPDRRDARFPRVVKFDLRNVATSDRLVVDGSYLRLKNVQVGYRLPETAVGKIGLAGLRVYAGATNLLTFSKLNEWNLDPEVESGRAVYYPQTALYTLGLNVKF